MLVIMHQRIVFFATILLLATAQFHECSGQGRGSGRLLVSGDGTRVLAGDHVFDAESRQQVCNLDLIKSNDWLGGTNLFGYASGISFDGSIVVVSKKYGYGGVDSRTRWFDVDESRRLRTSISFCIPMFSSNNRWLLLHRSDRGMIILDNTTPASPEPHFTFSSVGGRPCLSPDGQRVAYSWSIDDGEFQHQISVTEIQSLEQLRTFKVKSRGGTRRCNVDFGPKGRFLLAHDIDYFAVFDLHSADTDPIIVGSSEIKQFFDAKLVVDEDSARLLTYESDGQVKVWSRESEQPRLIATLTGWSGSLTVNTTGTRALLSRILEGGTPDKFKEIVCLDLASEKTIKTLWESSRLRDSTHQHEFSPCGKSFYGISDAGELLVYDSEDGELIPKD